MEKCKQKHSISFSWTWLSSPSTQHRYNNMRDWWWWLQMLQWLLLATTYTLVWVGAELVLVFYFYCGVRIVIIIYLYNIIIGIYIFNISTNLLAYVKFIIVYAVVWRERANLYWSATCKAPNKWARKSRSKWIYMETNTANEWWRMCGSIWHNVKKKKTELKKLRTFTGSRVSSCRPFFLFFLFFFLFGSSVVLIARVFRTSDEPVHFVRNWRYSRYCTWKSCRGAVDCCDATVATVLLAHFSIEYYFGSFNS